MNCQFHETIKINLMNSEFQGNGENKFENSKLKRNGEINKRYILNGLNGLPYFDDCLVLYFYFLPLLLLTLFCIVLINYGTLFTVSFKFRIHDIIFSISLKFRIHQIHFRRFMKLTIHRIYFHRFINL